MGTLTVALETPGMGFLHRAGLAGLWLTLDALNEELRGASPRAGARRLAELGSWDLPNRSVTLRWEGDGKEFFAELLTYAYPVDAEHGFLSFGALGDPLVQREQTFATHQSMMLSFLQHNKWRSSEKGKASGAIAVQIEDDVSVYRVLRIFDHKFRSDPFDPARGAEIGSMLVPGGSVRHTGLSGTGLEEPAERVLALRFGPIGCVYYLLRHQHVGERTRFEASVVIPEVTDLADYANLRRSVAQQTDLRRYYSAGPAEAALNLLLLDVGREAAKRLTQDETRRCRVVTFGKVAWSQQRTRVAVLDVGRVRRADVARFGAIRRHLQARKRTALPPASGKTRPARDTNEASATAWVDVPQVPELAAENLIRGRPWWRGFADFVADKERREHVFRWERKGLGEMVKDTAVMPEDGAARLVRACHEAWRRRLGRLGERARDQNLDFLNLMKQDFERTRIAFSRCKTQSEFRRTITDFWARGGSQAQLRDHWPDVLPYLTDHRKWEEGRDLALLALASYASETADTAHGTDETAGSGA